jgi:hypothetical protein
MIADLEDFGATIDALSSVGEDVYSRPEQAAFDAVVHLASIPHPRMIPDSDEFRNNMLSTFNVLKHHDVWELKILSGHQARFLPAFLTINGMPHMFLLMKTTRPGAQHLCAD